MPRIKILHIDDRLYNRLKLRNLESSQVKIVLKSKVGKTRLMLFAYSLANYARRKLRDVKKLEKPAARRGIIEVSIYTIF